MSSPLIVVRHVRDVLPGGSTLPPLAALWTDHHRAVAEFVRLAEAVPAAAWRVPRAEGKWTPAQEVAHIALSYEAFARDLRGGTPMRLKGNWWKRRLWRLVALSSVLRKGRLPRRVQAPREVRPPEQTEDTAELVALVRERVRVFEEAMSQMLREEPSRCVTHPYFGQLTLEQGLRLSAVHTWHHARNLEALSS